MNSKQPDVLSQANSLLRKGDALAARRLLFPYVRQNPGSEQAWLMLGMSLSDPIQQAECYRRVLQINPQNDQARQQLDKIDTAAGPDSLRQSLGVNRRPPPALTSTSPNGTSPESTALASANDQPPDSAGSRQAGQRKPTRRKRRVNRWLVLALIFIPVFCLICIGVAYIEMQWLALQQGADKLPVGPVSINLPTPTKGPFQLPPTWTPSPTPSQTPVPPPTLPPPPTATATLPPPAPTDAARIERIQQEVSELRGLPILAPVSSHMVTRDRAKEFLTSLLVSDERIQRLEKDALALTALGLIQPEYDLVNYSINGIADGLGGVYISWIEHILILGLRFSGMEHWVYAHEYDHALTDQHFDLDSMGVFPDCQSNEQRCTAIQALVEGDATLLMYQWLEEYATQQDYRDLINFRPPLMLLPEDSPPPFVEQDLNFPYATGMEFVKFLYDRGGWEEVNQAYQRLPESTEQILHPEKYLSAEAPMPVLDPALESALGAGWQPVKADILGEWGTTLVLAYGADPEAQIDLEEATEAAAGWGGDYYQVYTDESDEQTALAAHWAWDAAAEAAEFRPALERHLQARFRSAQIEIPFGDSTTPGHCWQNGEQVACVFGTDFETLWLQAPDLETLEQLRTLFPAFQ